MADLELKRVVKSIQGPKGPRNQAEGFRAPLPLILEDVGPKTPLFGSLDPGGGGYLGYRGTYLPENKHGIPWKLFFAPKP